jgi:hypothetical protein
VAVSGYGAANISDSLGELTSSSDGLVTASVGIGLWLTIAGGVVLIVGVLMAMNASDDSQTLSSQSDIGFAPSADPVVLDAAHIGSNPNITWTNTGVKYLMGYTTEPPSFGIWDRDVPGPPMLRFPYSEYGKAEALRSSKRLSRQVSKCHTFRLPSHVAQESGRARRCPPSEPRDDAR